uniref:Cilia- and flagella-associated protein 44 n=1 Tax=Chromera velia CCMP2878 TaxID=1169474 RepID=A0A0G4I0H2_9ALVE|eukprot:Cvel_1622.t1-p1 / transcript=Cvel_1622.t1 / gene=Cvel_1622 / organism=Chromera_velia_CCMP2878 / gene_product=WD repeat-containing protein 52, putative / transcript_product=WD repeat-containing protein 52, putative / location=Cvel_scaffold58:26152-38417(+) / protein_length=1974 / sequence_SO=supercontig / SO=protein_coding / is_pseudo=false
MADSGEGADVPPAADNGGEESQPTAEGAENPADGSSSAASPGEEGGESTDPPAGVAQPEGEGSSATEGATSADPPAEGDTSGTDAAGAPEGGEDGSSEQPAAASAGAGDTAKENGGGEAKESAATEGEEDGEAKEGEEGGEEGAAATSEEAAQTKSKTTKPEVVKIPDDFFYDLNDDDKIGQPTVTPPPQQIVLSGNDPINNVEDDPVFQFTRSMGFNFAKHANLHFVSDTKFAYISGRFVCISSIFASEDAEPDEILIGREDGGIGDLAVDPERKYLAVAEQSTSRSPGIYIYSLPVLKLYRVLRKGTERAYASVAFNPLRPDTLASVGSFPDFMLSVWDWKQERVVLRFKAFSQEVYTVAWSPTVPGHLTTSGLGHIRFWKMAKTFTGLKLQGELGKFGQSEITDVQSFCELPDGKVLCGSDYGKLLLWEGVFVKAEIIQVDAPEGGRWCHNGPVRCVFRDPLDESRYVSAGADGKIKWWAMAEIDVAEATDESQDSPITCLRAMDIPDADISHVALGPGGDVWIAQDNRQGRIFSIDPVEMQFKELVSFHSSSISGIRSFAVNKGLVLSASKEGTVRLWNSSQDGPALMRHRFRNDLTAFTFLPEDVSGWRVFAAGFADGVVRVMKVFPESLQLLQAVKTHKGPVTHITVSADGSFAAVVGADSNVFFLACGGDESKGPGLRSTPLTPVAFAKAPGVVTAAGWGGSSKWLTLGLKRGAVARMRCPDPSTIDNSETFEQPVTTLLASVDPDERPIVSTPREDGEGGDKDEAEEYSREAEKEREEKQKEREEARQEQLAKLKALDSLSCMVCLEEDAAVIVTGTGRFGEGIFTVPLDSMGGGGGTEETDEDPLHTEDANGEAGSGGVTDVGPLTGTSLIWLPKGMSPPSHLSLSEDETVLFAGFTDGRVLLVLDCVSGAVSALELSSEGDRLFVGARDGTMVALLFNKTGFLRAADSMQNKTDIDATRPHATDQQKVAAWMPAPNSVEDAAGVIGDEAARAGETSDALPGIADITDPNAISVQEAKLKSEEESAFAAAEEKKEGVREKVRQLRELLEGLMERNSRLLLPLENQELVVDGDWLLKLKESSEDQVTDVRRQLAWEVQRRQIAVDKLRQHFLGEVESERKEIFAFLRPVSVSSFRCTRLPPALEEQLGRLRELIRDAAGVVGGDDLEDGDGPNATGPAGGRGGPKTPGGVSRAATRAGGQTPGVGGAAGGANLVLANGESMSETQKQREMRKLLRQQRKAQIEMLMNTKPKDSYKDPADVEAIEEAKRTMGHIFLKTSPQYEVPEAQRMNAEKKRRQLLLLEESVHAIKVEFNARVAALSQFKQEVKQSIRRDLAALEDISLQLLAEADQSAPQGSSQQSLMPQQVGESAGGAGGASNLAQFTETFRKMRSLLEPNPEQDKLEFPESRFVYSEEDLDTLVSSAAEMSQEDEAAVNGWKWALRKGKEEGAGSNNGTSVDSTSAPPSNPTKQSTTLASRKEGRLRLRAAFFNKSKKNPDVKADRDAALPAVLRNTPTDLSEVVATFDAAVESLSREQAKLQSDLKNADLRLLTLLEELQKLGAMETKDELLHEKASENRQQKALLLQQLKQCQDQLLQKNQEIETWQSEEQELQAEFHEAVGENNAHLATLLKIFKKKIKRRKRNDNDDDDDDDEDEDEDEDDESDEDEDEEEEDVCPPGCDITVYENVQELRNRRADLEESLQEIQKAVEEIKKLQCCDDDDEGSEDGEGGGESRREREGSRNGHLPRELSKYVVFTRTALLQLIARIKELQVEKASAVESFRYLKRDKVVAQKEKKVIETDLQALTRKYEEVQMLRFGQVVDLDLIERGQPTEQMQELEEKCEEVERMCSRQIAEQNKQIEMAQEQLLSETRRNTELMDKIVKLGHSQLTLDQALNARLHSVTVNDPGPTLEKERREMARIHNLLAVQAKEIATLQAEINLFRRKGGHIYTTVTANRLTGHDGVAN